MGFLDTNARNPDITIAGITLALQFGNALPKYITGRKNITVVDRLAFWTTPCAISQRQVLLTNPHSQVFEEGYHLSILCTITPYFEAIYVSLLIKEE